MKLRRGKRVRHCPHCGWEVANTAEARIKHLTARSHGIYRRVPPYEVDCIGNQTRRLGR